MSDERQAAPVAGWVRHQEPAKPATPWIIPDPNDRRTWPGFGKPVVAWVRDDAADQARRLCFEVVRLVKQDRYGLGAVWEFSPYPGDEHPNVLAWLPIPDPPEVK